MLGSFKIHKFCAFYYCEHGCVLEFLLAFDKPYQVACSRAPQGQAEILRIMPKLVAKLSCEGLWIVRAILKAATGILLFAKLVLFLFFLDSTVQRR